MLLISSNMYEITDGEEYNWTINYFPFREVDPQKNYELVPQLEQVIFTHFFPKLRSNRKRRTQLAGNLSLYEMTLDNVEFVMRSTSEPFLKTAEPFLRLSFKNPEPKFIDKLPSTFPVTFTEDRSFDKKRYESITPNGFEELGRLNEAFKSGVISQKIMLLGLEDGEGFGYTEHNIETIKRRIREESLRYKDNPNKEYHFSRVNGSGVWKPVSWCVREGDLDEILTRVESYD